MNSFYNTIKLKDNEFATAKQKAVNQEDKIMGVFLKYPNSLFTPFEIQKMLNLQNVPITSIRRAITNLTEQKKLVKTDTMKQERYGKPNYCWRINGVLKQLSLF